MTREQGSSALGTLFGIIILVLIIIIALVWINSSGGFTYTQNVTVSQPVMENTEGSSASQETVSTTQETTTTTEDQVITTTSVELK